MRVLMMGPPGVGKGTQAERLARRWGVPAVSTGDLFRAHVAGGTPLGLHLREIVAAGDYVPDETTNAMVRERLASADAGSGFVLDGYPRTMTQVAELDRMLHVGITAVVLLRADVEVIVDRLGRRAADQGRADDTPEVIRHRIEVYERETAPLASVYEKAGLLVHVDGVGHPDVVAARIADAVDGANANRAIA